MTLAHTRVAMVFDGLHSGSDHDQIERITISPASEFIVGIVAVAALIITVVALGAVARSEKAAMAPEKDL